MLHKLSSRGSYEDINGGAHRTAASVVGIPALVRNLGFWDVQSGKTEKEGDNRASRNVERRKLYGDYLSTLRERIDRGDGHIVPGAKCPPFEFHDQPDSGVATLLRFWWHGMLTTIRLEYHTEYITLTSIIDLHVDAIRKCSTVLPDCPRYKVTSKMKAFNELFERRRTPDKVEHNDISDFLQLRVWETFEREVIDPPAPGGSMLAKTFGEVFLDSRGIVTGTKCFQPKEGEGADLVHSVRRMFEHEGRRSRMREDMEHGVPDPQWASDTVRRIWQFVEAEPELAETEFTVTGFLKGRVLFITALGPQPAPGAAPSVAGGGSASSWTPIRYFLHAHPDDEWQLGRLVDRINALGTMRLAATMEIGALRSTDGLMEDLATRINGAAEAIQLAMKGKGDDPTKEVSDIRSGYKALNRVIRRGVWYRLERSQYYLEQFRKECGALDETPVGGFQTYSDFVTRRMSSIFSYLQYLGTRMESIDSSNSSLERQYSWLKVASVTGSINNVVARMGEQDNEIEKIQYIGELALTAVLIPYYLGTVLFEHVYRPSGERRIWAWIILLGIFITIGIFRASGPLRKHWGRKDAQTPAADAAEDGEAPRQDGVKDGEARPSDPMRTRAWQTLVGLLVYYVLIIIFALLAPALLGSAEPGPGHAGESGAGAPARKN